VILAHVMGLPVEESVLQLAAPAGTGVLSIGLLLVRERLAGFMRRRRRA
jgi:hypothetical protein